ncbi:hypothetical protein [Treponema pectinovorum]|uniref:hypothetical protein n=1 Tax=Treponema pectinovorum TaxID=164 RepID=UPI003D8E0C78
MKNKILRILHLSIILSFVLAFFTSCSGVIFDTIREEVKLSDAQIGGDVNLLIRHTASGSEYLYICLGNIWKKDVNDAVTSGGTYNDTLKSYTGNWEQISNPGNFITSIASAYNSLTTKNELYAMSLYIKSVDNDGENKPQSWTVYYSADNGASWQTVTYTNTTLGTVVTKPSTSKSQKFAVFGTNTPKTQNRAAFLNLDGTIFRLEGGKATQISASPSYKFESLSDSSASIYASAISAATFDGSTFYFSSSSAITSNESRNTAATHLYAASGSTTYYRAVSDSAWTAKKVLSASIYSIASTSGKLLCGTSDGLQAINTNSSSEPDSSTSTAKNASSTLSSYYQVRNVLAIDPSKTDTATDLYASTDFKGPSKSTSATFQNVGLWAYYPGRDKWNKE